MKIGVPKEIKVKENRVACTPAAARMFVAAGHDVLVETNAGLGSGFPDDHYELAGATIVPKAADAWACDMVIKVKEPIASEYGFLRKDLLLFTYLHLAADKLLTEALATSGTAGIAYETVQIGRRLPLLEPMSEIAGRMSALVGAFYLSKAQGGKGVLLGGVPGVLPGNVLIIGGGTSGINAGRVAAGRVPEGVVGEGAAGGRAGAGVYAAGSGRSLIADRTRSRIVIAPLPSKFAAFVSKQTT